MHVNIDRVFTTISRNLGLHDYSTYINNWIEWAYEAEKLIGSISTFVQKEAVYSADGAKASGTIEFTSNPVSGDSIELNGVTLYFRKATDLGQAKSPNEIEIGTTLAITLSNTTVQYGLIQSLVGFQNVINKTSPYVNSAIFNYPEALNVADYSLTFGTDGTELVDLNEPLSGGSLMTITSSNSLDFASNTSGSIQYVSNIANGPLVVGDVYVISATVSNYTGNGNSNSAVGFSTSGGISGGVGERLRFDNGTIYSAFTATSTGQPDLFIQDNVTSATLSDISVQKMTNGLITITSKEIGNKGNDYTLQSDTSNANISGGSLSGGKDLYRNQQLRLPDDNIKMLAIRDSNHYELRKTSSVHTGRLGDDALRYYIQGNRLNVASTGVTELTVVYLAYPTDLRGWPMIKDGHETAVAQYIMWQQNLVKYYNGQIAQYIVKDLEKRWYLLCGKTRGDDGMPTAEELKQIGNIWNTMIPIKNNRGLIDL